MVDYLLLKHNKKWEELWEGYIHMAARGLSLVRFLMVVLNCLRTLCANSSNCQWQLSEFVLCINQWLALPLFTCNHLSEWYMRIELIWT